MEFLEGQFRQPPAVMGKNPQQNTAKTRRTMDHKHDHFYPTLFIDIHVQIQVLPDH